MTYLAIVVGSVVFSIIIYWAIHFMPKLRVKYLYEAVLFFIFTKKEIEYLAELAKWQVGDTISLAPIIQNIYKVHTLLYLGTDGEKIYLGNQYYNSDSEIKLELKLRYFKLLSNHRLVVDDKKDKMKRIEEFTGQLKNIYHN